MRLRRLDLTRYGKFTNAVIDFGEAIADAPDLHIVYGPNEAGKSTAFRAFLDLLFGIEMQSPFNFLHPYDTMRVGGCLELSVGARELVRIKVRHQSLRDGANQPVSESLLAGDLGGLDRAAYRSMFSLDDDTLETGGDAILASNGELGQLLFSASAGLAELSGTLIAIRAEASKFFTTQNPRSGELSVLKTQLTTLKDQRAKIDTLASQYNRLAAVGAETNAGYEAALAEQSTAQSGLARVRRLVAGLPRLAALRRCEERLKGFADLPIVPAGWLGELTDLGQAENQHGSAMALAEAEVNRLTDALDAIQVDTVALGMGDRLEGLTERGARHRTAELDLPLRERELADADIKIQGLLQRLEREGDGTDPAQLRFSNQQAAGLNTLMESRSGIETRLAGAGEELSLAQFGLKEAQQVLEREPAAAEPEILAAIGSALQAWRDSDHPRRLRESDKARHLQLDELKAKMLTLLPWKGETDALEALVPPDPSTVASWVEGVTLLHEQHRRRRDEVERLESELAPRAAELNAMKAVAGLVSDQQAAEIRTAREAAWSVHRSTLDGASADAFEMVLRREDFVSASRLGHERELAKLHETAQVVAVKESEVTRARTLLSEASTERQQLEDFVATAIADISPELVGVTLTALPGWFERRDATLGCWRQLCQAERDHAQAIADGEVLRERLLQTLRLAGGALEPTTAIDVMIGAARAIIERGAHFESLRQAITKAEAEVRRREAAAGKAVQADTQWQSAWRHACKTSWLGAEAAVLPVTAMRAILTTSAELGASLEQRVILAGRIRGMQDDQAAFRRELEVLATELTIDLAGRSPSDAEKVIATRVLDAARQETMRNEHQGALAEAMEASRAARTAAEAHARRIEDMKRVLGASSLIEVAGKLRDVQEKVDIEKLAG
jgi:uncharacterized protein YhaN